VRQLFLEKGALEIKEVCEPLLDDYSVLVDVSYSFIGSGNDLTKILTEQKDKFFHNFPVKIKKLVDLIVNKGGDHARSVIKNRRVRTILPVGHSCSGKVIAAGKRVKRFRAGDLVACAGLGFAHHAEIVCVPESLVVRVNDELLLQGASLTSIGAIALQSIRRSRISLGEFVCVVGADSLGQLIIQLASLVGARVIALDYSQEKLDLAQRSGAEFTYLINDNVQDNIAQLTQEYGVDCSLLSPEYVSNKEANLIVGITRKQGRILLVGSKSILFEQEFIQQKEIEVIFSMTYGPGRYDAEYEFQGKDYPYHYVRWTENRNMEAFLNLIKGQKINLDVLIGETISFENVEQKFNQSQDSGLGFVISYNIPLKKKEDCLEKEGVSFIPAKKASSTEKNVTFFGANSSTRLSLLPIIQNIRGVKIHKIIDRDVTRAIDISKQYIGATALTGEPELFYNDELTDVVCVSSHDSLHVEHIIKTLKNGKALYLVRPFSFTEDDLERLKDYLDCNKSARLYVGYYRTQAPFMQKIKKNLKKRRSPLMISYRLNLRALDDCGSIDMRPRFGNVVDKASHVIDLFCFLTDAKPLSLSTESLRPTREHIFLSDNFVAQIQMSDGSVCSLEMTSLGHRDNGIERMEINYDGKTIVMEDFIRLVGFGLPKGFDEVVRVPDKGRERFTRKIFENLDSENQGDFFSAGSLYQTAHLTMHLDRLVCQGGGEINL
jgi:threonine dehydrogenase-like Zn-dependent dehydrogenase/predicted dehydrogenase